mgnify:CR=1 FL=1
MTLKQIYETLNEDGVLKSAGPFKYIITDTSFSGQETGEEKIYKPLIIGNITVHGTRFVIKREIKNFIPENK